MTFLEQRARTSWPPTGANRSFEIFDPLFCPDCGGSMRIVAFIEEPRVVRAILEHLVLWDEPRPAIRAGLRTSPGPPSAT